MFWSLKNTEITSFSKKLKFYFIVLLQVFSSMTARQSSPTENWKERELTKRDLWIKHINPLCIAVKLRACCKQHSFACLCAFAGKWRCLYGESARRHTPAGHLPSEIASTSVPVSPSVTRKQLPQPRSAWGKAELMHTCPQWSIRLIPTGTHLRDPPGQTVPLVLHGCFTQEGLQHLKLSRICSASFLQHPHLGDSLFC